MKILVVFIFFLILAFTPLSAAAIHDAAREGQAAEVIRLFKAGVNVNEKDKYGQTALMIAASRGHLEVGRTALGWAVKKGQHSAAEILRQSGGKE